MTGKPTDPNRASLRASVDRANKRNGMGLRDEDSKDTPLKTTSIKKTTSLKDAVDRSNAKHGRRLER